MKLKRRSFLQSTGARLPAAMAARLVAQNVRQENRPAAEQTVDHYLADVSEVFKSARTAPTLRDPTGKVVRVVDPLSLRNSVAEASPHTTILLANGRYPMDELLVTCDGLSIRDESGNREAVVLDGQGKFTKVIQIRGANDVTIADLTVANSRQYGIFFLGDSDVQRLKVYNVKFHNLLSARHHWFVSPQTGNLHLTKQASVATGKGVQLKEVSDDFDGQLREGPIDLGADQVGHP